MTYELTSGFKKDRADEKYYYGAPFVFTNGDAWDFVIGSLEKLHKIITSYGLENEAHISYSKDVLHVSFVSINPISEIHESVGKEIIEYINSLYTDWMSQYDKKG